MTPFQALILGLVQGITEFLPISSSGHLVIAQSFFALPTPPIVFDVFVHLATALAVIIVLWENLKTINLKLIKKILVATIPAVIVGFLLYPHIPFIFSSLNLVAIALLITSALLFISKLYSKKANKTQLNYQQALFIGTFQALAILPGISRSGSTIVAALITGLKPLLAFNFSFLLSLPAIFGATLLQFKDLTILQSQLNLSLLIGFLSALFSGILALKLLKSFVSKGRLHLFGFYCLILGLSLLIF